VLSEVRVTGAVLLTYRPLAERDAAALVGARLAASFGRANVVFASRLRPDRFADFRTVVALLGRNDNASELGRWLSELRAAVQGGVPVALVLINGVARPPAQHWPDDENASVIAISTADLDRDIASVIAILTPFVGSEDASEATRPSRRADATAPSDVPDGAAATGVSDQGRSEDLEAATAERGFDDADLEALAQSRFARPSSQMDGLGRQATEEEEGVTPSRLAWPILDVTSGTAPSPPVTPTPASAPIAEPPQSASASGSLSLARPPAAMRMPGAGPWPKSIRPSDRGFPPPPQAAAGVAASQPRRLIDPRPAEASRSRGRAWLGGALGLAVAAVALAYALRHEIAALLGS
jgi:hypothetical protein